jgi:hypothetical protein
VADNQRETGSRHAHCSFRLANIGIARGLGGASVVSALAIRPPALRFGIEARLNPTRDCAFLWDLIHVILVAFVSCMFRFSVGV